MKEAIKPLEYRFKDWNNQYNSLVGETPFNKDVNELIGNYWVRTGEEIPLEDAMFAVLAHRYNTHSQEDRGV